MKASVWAERCWSSVSRFKEAHVARLCLIFVILATGGTLHGQGQIAVGAGGADAVVMPGSGTISGNLPANTAYGLIGTTDTSVDLSTFANGYRAGVLGILSGVGNSGHGYGLYGQGPSAGVFGSGFRGVSGVTSFSTGSGLFGDGGGVGAAIVATNAPDAGVFVGTKTAGQFLTPGASTAFSLPANTSVAVIANAGFGLDLSSFSDNQNIGLYAIAAAGSGRTATAGVFNGNVAVYGSLSKGGGSFKIDHPLDPEHKYLQHSFVESPDMKNIYDGIAVLDGNGQAVVQLPNWFEALNSDYRYQLTAIGSPSPALYVAQEVKNGRFIIGGGVAGQKVSWQVTGIREDAWAKANRIEVEQEKNESERGRYLYPEAYGLGPERSIDPVTRKAAAARR